MARSNDFPIISGTGRGEHIYNFVRGHSPSKGMLDKLRPEASQHAIDRDALLRYKDNLLRVSMQQVENKDKAIAITKYYLLHDLITGKGEFFTPNAGAEEPIMNEEQFSKLEEKVSTHIMSNQSLGVLNKTKVISWLNNMGVTADGPVSATTLQTNLSQDNQEEIFFSSQGKEKANPLVATRQYLESAVGINSHAGDQKRLLENSLEDQYYPRLATTPNKKEALQKLANDIHTHYPLALASDQGKKMVREHIRQLGDVESLDIKSLSPEILRKAQKVSLNSIAAEIEESKHFYRVGDESKRALDSSERKAVADNLRVLSQTDNINTEALRKAVQPESMYSSVGSSSTRGRSDTLFTPPTARRKSKETDVHVVGMDFDYNLNAAVHIDQLMMTLTSPKNRYNTKVIPAELYEKIQSEFKNLDFFSMNQETGELLYEDVDVTKKIEELVYNFHENYSGSDQELIQGKHELNRAQDEFIELLQQPDNFVCISSKGRFPGAIESFIKRVEARYEALHGNDPHAYPSIQNRLHIIGAKEAHEAVKTGSGGRKPDALWTDVNYQKEHIHAPIACRLATELGYKPISYVLVDDENPARGGTLQNKELVEAGAYIHTRKKDKPFTDCFKAEHINAVSRSDAGKKGLLVANNNMENVKSVSHITEKTNNREAEKKPLYSAVKKPFLIGEDRGELEEGIMVSSPVTSSNYKKEMTRKLSEELSRKSGIIVDESPSTTPPPILPRSPVIVDFASPTPDPSPTVLRRPIRSEENGVNQGHRHGYLEVPSATTTATSTDESPTLPRKAGGTEGYVPSVVPNRPVPAPRDVVKIKGTMEEATAFKDLYNESHPDRQLLVSKSSEIGKITIAFTQNGKPVSTLQAKQALDQLKADIEKNGFKEMTQRLQPSSTHMEVDDTVVPPRPPKPTPKPNVVPGDGRGTHTEEPILSVPPTRPVPKPRPTPKPNGNGSVLHEPTSPNPPVSPSTALKEPVVEGQKLQVTGKVAGVRGMFEEQAKKAQEGAKKGGWEK